MADPEKNNGLDEIVIACRKGEDGTIWYAITVPTTISPVDAVTAGLQMAVQVAINRLRPEYRDDPEKTTLLLKFLSTNLAERFQHSLDYNELEHKITVPPGTKGVGVDPIAFLKARDLSTDPEEHRRLRDGG